MDSQRLDCFLSKDRSSKAVLRLKTNQYDIDAWNVLIKEAAQRPIDEVDGFYEELVKTFPTCGKFWKLYIEHELRNKRFEKISELFKRSLEEVISVDLYKCYLSYILEVKADEIELVYKAYRFTLDKVGMDPYAVNIWNDYIQFLKDREVDSSYLESQKITAVRKAYQEGIVTPMFHIDNIWKEYVNYEQGINLQLAEKMTQDRSRDHMNARRVAKEWEIIIRGLNRATPASPPNFTSEESRQIDIWRKYIIWEKSNPLRTENNLIVYKRVTYAYKQFLLCFGHHPHAWHEYASYLDEQIRLMTEKGDLEMSKKLQKEEALLYERAIRGFMTLNFFIHFSYADFQEGLNDKKKALDIFNNLLEKGHREPNLDLTLVYIQLMRFARRTEGIKSARAVFKRAREDDRCSHQMYSASALMEYYCTKDQMIACKIFELGMKKFSQYPDYILSYIHFMNNLNEENNTRVLFERVLSTCSLPPKDTIEIWNAFLDFETDIGDLTSINKIEKRRTAALEKVFPKCTETSWTIDRYKFQSLYPCTLTELKSLRYNYQQSSIGLPSTNQLLEELNDNNLKQNSQIPATRKSRTTTGQNPTKLSNGGENIDMLLDCEADYYQSCSNQDGFYQPDLDQMIPFKPVMGPAFGAHTVPGGVFPPPPAVGNLMSRLPQSSTFWGPFVDVGALMNTFSEVNFDMLYQNFLDSRRDTSKPNRNKKLRTE